MDSEARDPEASSRPRLGLPGAIGLGFAALALVSAVFVARLGGGLGGLRLTHHVTDLGHWALLGAPFVLGHALLSRLPGGRTRLGAGAAVSAAFAWLLARRDVAGFAEEHGGEAEAILLALLVAVVAAGPLLALGVGRACARPWLRGAALFVGLVVATANHLVLLADYRGLHLFAAVSAALLIAGALTGAAIPRRLAFRARPTFAALIVCVLAAPSVAIPPSNRLRVELSRVDGSPFVYVLAQLGWGKRKSEARVPPELTAWFHDRRADAAIPPSGPSLLPADPIVIVLGIDSLRADLLTKASTRRRLPNLARLEQQSLTFTMARSPGARTITTWSSVFTGRYTSGLRYRGGGNRLSIRDDPTKRFPEILVERGVTAITFVSYGALGEKGLGRGFSEVVDVPAPSGQKYALSPQVLPRMVERIARHERGSLFVFAHWMDPHYPYDAVTDRGEPFQRYLAEAELADKNLGELITALEAQGSWPRTVLVVLSDHGEAFGQHGTPYHTVTLYEELLRVPLVIRIPGASPRRIETPVSLMDLGPTLLDLFGVETPASFLGESLLPFARGEDPAFTRPIGAERSGTRALVLGKHKVIVDRERGRDEIYDLEADPLETQNLADDLGAEGQNQIELVDLFFDTHGLGIH